MKSSADLLDRRSEPKQPSQWGPHTAQLQILLPPPSRTRALLGTKVQGFVAGLLFNPAHAACLISRPALPMMARLKPSTPLHRSRGTCVSPEIETGRYGPVRAWLITARWTGAQHTAPFCHMCEAGDSGPRPAATRSRSGWIDTVTAQVEPGQRTARAQLQCPMFRLVRGSLWPGLCLACRPTRAVGPVEAGEPILTGSILSDLNKIQQNPIR